MLWYPLGRIRFFAIWCVYAGIFGRIQATEAQVKAYATCGIVWGIIIFLSLIATGLVRIARE